MNDDLYDLADSMQWPGEDERTRALECLAECARAGAKPDAVADLAAMLGLADQYEGVRP